jgi:hypothetical protein
MESHHLRCEASTCSFRGRLAAANFRPCNDFIETIGKFVVACLADCVVAFVPFGNARSQATRRRAELARSCRRPASVEITQTTTIITNVAPRDLAVAPGPQRATPLFPVRCNFGIALVLELTRTASSAVYGPTPGSIGGTPQVLLCGLSLW